MASRTGIVIITALLWAAGCGSDPVTPGLTGGGGAGGEAQGGGGSGGDAQGGGGTGGMTEPCWDLGPVGWSTPEPVSLVDLAGEKEREPMLTADGLTLYYSAEPAPAAPHRPYRATRATLDEPFTGGELLATWESYRPVGNPWIVGNQLFFSGDYGGGELMLASSIFDGNVWSFPADLGPLVNDTDGTSISNGDPSLDATSARMMFTRNHGGFDLDIYEASRSPAIPGQPFQAVAPVSFNGFDPGAASLCPALSPDGLHMFFSSTDPIDVSGGQPPAGALTVWYVARTDLDDEWGDPIPIETFDDDDEHTCVMALRGDGCELWVQRFILGQATNSYFRSLR